MELAAENVRRRQSTLYSLIVQDFLACEYQKRSSSNGFCHNSVNSVSFIPSTRRIFGTIGFGTAPLRRPRVPGSCVSGGKIGVPVPQFRSAKIGPFAGVRDRSASN